ncbi:hypothetical protein OQA88_11482 [Cercophora sp. LCS_1]
MSLQQAPLDPTILPKTPAGRRMSWVANRQTTRVEDIAYCLLGIFGVQMPLIYGEGDKAFLRLQEAIAEDTDDLSLFSWDASTQGLRDHDAQYSGALAWTPSLFPAHVDPDTQSFTLANRDIRFTAYLRTDSIRGGFSMSLYCRDKRQTGVLVVRLLKTSSGYIRHAITERRHEEWIDDLKTEFSEWGLLPTLVSLPKTINWFDDRAEDRHRNAFQIHLITRSEELHGTLIHVDSDFIKSFQTSPIPPFWDTSTNIALTDGHPNFTGMVALQLNVSTDSGEMVSIYPTANTDRVHGCEGPYIFELPISDMEMRHRMRPLHYLTYTGRVFRKAFLSGMEKVQFHWPQNSDAPSTSTVSVSVNLESKDGPLGLIHRVSVYCDKIESTTLP